MARFLLMPFSPRQASRSAQHDAPIRRCIASIPRSRGGDGMSETEAAKALCIYLERIERLTEERKAIADDIGDIFKELESNGYDKHAAKIVLKIRAADDGMAQYTDRTATVDIYLAALGMLPDRAPAPARSAHVENVTQFPLKGDPKSSALAPPSAATKATGTTPLVSVATPFKLRPHCQHPANCAGYGSNHCHSCKVASATLQHGALA